MTPRRLSLALCFALSHGASVGGAGGWGLSQPAVAADPDLQAQYQAVLAALRRPPVSGVLITEILPDSAAGAAGVRAGDIITSFYGQQILTLPTLREQVAEAVARRIEEGATSRALLRARRILPNGQPDDIVVQVAREPLGIRAVEVQAGVEGPRNPPPSLRGKLTMHWQALLETLRADGGLIALRTHERLAPEPLAPAGPETWLGWQRYRVEAEGAGRLSATLELARVDPSGETVQLLDRATFTFRLQLGDYYASPAFVLDTAGARYSGIDGPIQVQASRLGEAFHIASPSATPAGARPTGPAARRRTESAPLNALVQPAVPLVAAAMPHEIDAVLPLHLVSIRDFLPRPGYVLATRGRHPLPTSPAMPPAPGLVPDQAWRVDLLHFGVVIESYWFTDARRLLCVQSDIGTPVIHRRVANPDHASIPADASTSTRPPATRPAPRPPP